MVYGRCTLAVELERKLWWIAAKRQINCITQWLGVGMIEVSLQSMFYCSNISVIYLTITDLQL